MRLLVSGIFAMLLVAASICSAEPTKIKIHVKCLADTAYLEARGEGTRGMRAVADVVVNRTKDDRFPNDICAVVREKKRGKCQFHTMCRKMHINRKDPLYMEAVQVAQKSLTEDVDTVKGSTFFVKKTLRPSWTYTLKKHITIGRHTFYGFKKDQNR